MDRWRTETIKRLCELTASLLASGLSAPREQIDAALSFPAIRGVLGQSLAEPLQSALFAATRGRISAPINTEPTLMVFISFCAVRSISTHCSGSPVRAVRRRLHGCLLRPEKAVRHGLHRSALLRLCGVACATLWAHTADSAGHTVNKRHLRDVAWVRLMCMCVCVW